MIYVKRYFGCFVTDRRTDATMYCYVIADWVTADSRWNLFEVDVHLPA